MPNMATTTKNALGGEGTLVDAHTRATAGKDAVDFNTADIRILSDDAFTYIRFPHTAETRKMHTDPAYGEDMKIGDFRRLFTLMVNFLPKKSADGTQKPAVKAPIALQLPADASGTNQLFQRGNGIIKLRMEGTIQNPDPDTSWDDDGNMINGNNKRQTAETVTSGKDATTASDFV